MPQTPQAASRLGFLKARIRRLSNDITSTPSPSHVAPVGAMPPPGSLTQFARGMPDPRNQMPSANTEVRRGQSVQGFQHNGLSTSHYPPSSNPNPRQFNTTEVTRLPLAKSSMPQRSQMHRPRADSNSSMPPLGEPPSHALPPRPGADHHRRANSEDGSVHPAPSLPSNLGTPYGSPPGANGHGNLHQENGHYGDMRSPTRNLLNVQRASNDMQPFMLSSNSSVNVIGSQPGPGIVRHHSTRNQFPDVAVPQSMSQGYVAQLGFKQSPAKPEMSIPIRDANIRRSYVGNSPPNGRVVDGRASSPTVDRRLAFPRPMAQDRSREPTMFQEDEDFEEHDDLNSNYPFDDDPGTPRAAVKKLDRRNNGYPESPTRTVTLRGITKPKKRRRNSLDYDDIALERMSYVELQKQPFDMNPTQATIDQRAASSANEPLEDKLSRCRDKGDKEQKQLFNQMSLADWERSGDWFLEQFSSITQRLKEARQNKRVMVDRFEAEVSGREEAVRARTETINKKLDKIKHKGEDMLADREG
ncbi:extracellular mutant protein 11-domain-containing protein [Plectosphaerella plurivora]|uniref:Extracellular mutant protein 11-domain-containing protein n=1 Tax=Plectosphaerella plurivora TaxID=936078 RepID=A0A9P8V7Z4_9PEZI|nr:extracellular mutant protein 11-domain-containing protein [Plectosphaerella plurivora]